MQLEGRGEDCCSSTFVLRVNGRPCGKYEGRWFSEGLDIYRMGRPCLQFQKMDWLGSDFRLEVSESGQFVGKASPAGMFTASWTMVFPEATGTLEKESFFGNSYIFNHGRSWARVEPLGCCERGWRVEGEGLAEEEMLLIGLVFHIVIHRQQAAAAAAAGGS
jgi:hypothetical protein